MKELYSILVYLMLLVLPNTRRTSGSNVEETSERYKIEGKITIQGFKPSGKNLVYHSDDLYLSLHVDIKYNKMKGNKTSIKLTIFLKTFLKALSYSLILH